MLNVLTRSSFRSRHKAKVYPCRKENGLHRFDENRYTLRERGVWWKCSTPGWKYENATVSRIPSMTHQLHNGWISSLNIDCVQKRPNVASVDGTKNYPVGIPSHCKNATKAFKLVYQTRLETWICKTTEGAPQSNRAKDLRRANLLHVPRAAELRITPGRDMGCHSSIPAPLRWVLKKQTWILEPKFRTSSPSIPGVVT